MFDLSESDLQGEDVQKAVPEGEEGTPIETSIEDDQDSEEIDNQDEIQTPEGNKGDEEGQEEEPEDDKEDSEKVEEAHEDADAYKMLMSGLEDNGVLEVGEGKEYGNDPESFQQLISDNIESAKKGAVESYMKDQSEEAKSLYAALDSGMSVDEYLKDGYAEEVDFNNVKTHNEYGEPIRENLGNLVEDQMLKQGYTLEEAQERVLDLGEAGILEKEAVRAHKWLIKNQESEKENRTKEQAENKRIKAEEAENNERQFKESITGTRDIVGFKVSESDASKLYDYMTKPINKKGETQFDIDDNEKNRLLYPYLAMKKFNKDSLSKEIKTKSALKLKKELSRSKDIKASQKGSSMNGSKRGKTTKDNELDFSAFDNMFK